MNLDESCENKLKRKSCIQLKHNILASLNITPGATNTTLIFWNKYQLFVYDTNNINDVKYFVPEFHIKKILVLSNIIIFLDNCGNIHISSLKFKNSAQRLFKVGFRPKAQNIVAVCRYSENTVLCLKYENNSYYLCVNKLNTEFQLESQATLYIEEHNMPSCNNIILISKIISIDNQSSLKNVFNLKDKWREGILVTISFDKLSVYCSLTSLPIAESTIKFMKLYTCPSPLCDIKMFESDTVNFLIGLTMGSIIKLGFNNKQIVTEHLNCALHRFEFVDGCLYYTDGDTMWICREVFSSCRNFRQLFVQNVSSFIAYENQIALTTFQNLLYLFSLDDDSIYVSKENEDTYCPADKVLNNSSYLVNILEELDKNKEVVKKMSIEKNYLICLSLSKREDIMNKMIQSRVEVFHKYEDALMKYKHYILPEPLKKYFDEDIVIFLIHFDCSSLKQFFSEMLSYINHMNIHMSFHTKHKTLKVITVKMQNLHNLTHILLPLHVNNINDEVKIDIKLIAKIPTAFDKENNLWPVLYSNCMIIKSPQFIKTEDLNHVKYLKDSKNNLEKLINESAGNYYGNLFKIKKNLNTEESHKWNTYVKLPDTYESILKNDEIFVNQLNSKQVCFLSEQMKNESFLKCKSTIALHVNNCKVILSIANEEFTNYYKLKLSCEDIAVAYNLRNFFSNVFYKYFTADICASVCSELYTTTENIRKALQENINAESQSSILPMLKEFNKDVIGALYL